MSDGRAYYNEFDPFCAEWLRNLIAAGHLPAGRVDARDLRAVQPDEPAAVAHFFAGIGGWPYALALAGWPADRPVWTGSCPCQPFSSAGKRRGAGDARHLWPTWFALIRERRPATLLGEQVASADGRAWLAGVRADLESLGYAVGAADLCAASVGAPHIRGRLFWVADGHRERRAGAATRRAPAGRIEPLNGRTCRRASDPTERGWHGNRRQAPQAGLAGARPVAAGVVVGDAEGSRGRLPDADRIGLPGLRFSERAAEPRASGSQPLRPGGDWGEHWEVWQDGKARRTQPGLLPVAHGVPGRTGRIRAYGNAIVPQVAAAFVRAFLEAEAVTA